MRLLLRFFTPEELLLFRELDLRELYVLFRSCDPDCRLVTALLREDVRIEEFWLRTSPSELDRAICLFPSTLDRMIRLLRLPSLVAVLAAIVSPLVRLTPLMLPPPVFVCGVVPLPSPFAIERGVAGCLRSNVLLAYFFPDL